MILEKFNFVQNCPILATRKAFCTIVCQYFLKWVGTGTNERFYMCKLLCINIQYFLKEFDIFWHTVLMTFKQCWLIQNKWWQTRVKYPCKYRNQFQNSLNSSNIVMRIGDIWFETVPTILMIPHIRTSFTSENIVANLL